MIELCVDNIIDHIKLFDHRLAIIPVLSDVNKHRCENRISFLYIKDYETNESYIANFHHHDFDQQDIDELLKAFPAFAKNPFVYNSSILIDKFDDIFDMDLCYWMIFNDQLNVQRPSDMETYYRWYMTQQNVNDFIPITILIPFYETLCTQFKECLPKLEREPIEFYQNTILNNLARVENFGIPVNHELYVKKSGVKASIAYSHYKPYTTTGRPSNTFRGVNFAGLNKIDGSRKLIQVGNSKNYLVEFDYDSYHVKLAAKLIGFNLPSGNLHDYFGRQYFNTPMLTDEQYAETKGITFQLMYGTIPPQYRHIDFFRAMHEYREQIWIEFNKVGYIRMPVSGRKLLKENYTDLSSNKLFNYILQGYETEVNGLRLGEILIYLYNKKSRLTLYTYDSFLFEYHFEDPPSFINDISNILNYEYFRANVKIGKSYHNMVKYK